MVMSHVMRKEVFVAYASGKDPDKLATESTESDEEFTFVTTLCVRLPKCPTFSFFPLKK